MTDLTDRPAASYATDLAAAQGFTTFEHAYLHHLGLVARTGSSNAARGVTSRERLAVSFTVRNPRARLITNPVRRSNLVFNFAEFLWFATGQNTVAMLSYYAPSVARYSADGFILTGTAYGPRLFGPIGFDGRRQWDCALDALREDPESKRAYLTIALPQENRSLANPDVACTLGLQFLIRGGRLHCISYMRANDAYRGVVSDVFSFTMLQEYMAATLGLPLGDYVHFAGSYHVYESDFARAEELLTSSTNAFNHSPLMPAMPTCDQHDAVETVARMEQQLRGNQAPLSERALTRSGLPSYWRHVVVLFELYRQVIYGCDRPADWLDQLPESYRALMGQRFPILTQVGVST